MISTPQNNSLTPEEYAKEIFTKDFWYEETRQLCIDYIESCRPEFPSLEKLRDLVLPKARETVPLEIKSELVEYVYNYLKEERKKKKEKQKKTE